MSKFIYVFSDHDKDTLLARGYILLKSDSENGIYIFLNSEYMDFSDSSMDFVLSDILTF